MRISWKRHGFAQRIAVVLIPAGIFAASFCVLQRGRESNGWRSSSDSDGI